jgi:hypothetical protein
MEENKNKIYRNLPEGYNKNQDFLDRRQEAYNPSPLSNQRTSDSYYTIKNFDSNEGRTKTKKD